MKKFYEQEIEEIYQSIATTKNGLSQDEADQRLISGGKNVLKQKNKKSPLKIFFSQFKNMMVILLLLVGAVSFVYSLVTNESIIEAIVIYSCVFVNILMGFFQEMKSENAIEALRDMTVSKAQVKRDGKWIEIETAKLVVGDIISLEPGDKVPADARIIKAVNATVDESILTGESIAVDKKACVLEGNKLIQDQVNMIFSGTNLVNGRIEAVVVACGMDSELGKIAGRLDTNAEELTPLQVKVKKVSGFITIIACFLIALTFIYGLVKNLDALSIIMLCISMVLASVPEDRKSVV